MKIEIGRILLVFLCLVGGCVTLRDTEVDGKADTVITHFYASKEVRDGDTWKVYLRASSPNGEMRRIFAFINQPGMQPYPVSIIRVKKESQKELSGFITLATGIAETTMDGVLLRLTVQIQDGRGTFTEPMIFPLSINTHSAQEPPPPGIFKEENLGPVMVIMDNGSVS